VKAALEKATAAKEAADRNAAAEQLEAAKSIERQRADEERARVQRSIDERLNLAEDAFKREKFGECQRLCDEAIRLDFANERARKLKETPVAPNSIRSTPTTSRAIASSGSVGSKRCRTSACRKTRP
jgi:hypothetical protein